MVKRLLTAAAAICLPLVSAAQDPDKETCVQAGLRWLIRHQSVDGRWSDTDFVTLCKKEAGGPCGAQGKAISDIGSTSLALSAFLGAGYCHLSKDSLEDKSVGDAVRQGFKWLIAQQAADGSFGSPKGNHFIEEQAMAATALSEVFGLSTTPAFKDPAKRALEFLLSTRMKEKGWRMRGKEGEPDTAATGWALIALYSARRSDLVKPEAELKEALETLKPPKAEGKKKGPVVDRAFHLAIDLMINGSATEGAAGRVADLVQDLKTNQALRFDPLLSFVMMVARKRGDPEWQAERKSLAVTIGESQNTPKKTDPCLDGSWNPSPQSPVAYGRVTVTAYHVLTAEGILGFRNAVCTPE